MRRRDGDAGLDARRRTERPIQEAWPLRGVIVWTLGLVVVANIALAVIRLVG